MKVLRKVKMKVDYFELGDQIKINLKDMGKYTATVHQTYIDGTALCIFDNCVANMPMNKENTNEGGFNNSDLRQWMNTVLYSRFPKKIRARMVQFSEQYDGVFLRVPTQGEMFGGSDESLEEDHEDRLPLMKDRKHRICMSPDDEYCWYWLWNKRVVNAASFALVTAYGLAGTGGASSSLGVRPAFVIRNL